VYYSTLGWRVIQKKIRDWGLGVGAAAAAPHNPHPAGTLDAAVPGRCTQCLDAAPSAWTLQYLDAALQRSGFRVDGVGCGIEGAGLRV